MSKFTIKQIFIDNWDKFVSENQELIIRPVVFKEVERMINCGNPEFGYAMYYCEHCDKFMLLIYLKRLFIANIDILYLLYQNNFVYIF